MTTFFRAIAVFTFAVISFAHAAGQISLQCSVPDAAPGAENAVASGSEEETARLDKAPLGAKRVREHRLKVNWARGTKFFVDKPPYDELGGLNWIYCGYDPTLKLHLISKADDDLFTGVLLDQESGSLLPGGEAVLFSPDRRLYLAYEMVDGEPVSRLRLYKRTGELLWKGYAAILSPDGESVVVDSWHMLNMRWDSKNRPQATLFLDDGRTMTVTLMRDKKGKLDWLPKIVAN